MGARFAHNRSRCFFPKGLTCSQADKSGKYALLWTFIRHYKWTLLAATPPRLAFTGFTFAQPFLVQRVLTYTADTTESNTRNVAYGLIGAYAIVYIGIAVCRLPMSCQVVKLIMGLRYHTPSTNTSHIVLLPYAVEVSLASSTTRPFKSVLQQFPMRRLLLL